jgi:hypothetical protein
MSELLDDVNVSKSTTLRDFYAFIPRRQEPQNEK